MVATGLGKYYVGYTSFSYIMSFWIFFNNIAPISVTIITKYTLYSVHALSLKGRLFPVRKFLLCAIAFAPCKLRVVLKIAD